MATKKVSAKADTTDKPKRGKKAAEVAEAEQTAEPAAMASEKVLDAPMRDENAPKPKAKRGKKTEDLRPKSHPGIPYAGGVKMDEINYEFFMEDSVRRAKKIMEITRRMFQNAKKICEDNEDLSHDDALTKSIIQRLVRVKMDANALYETISDPRLDDGKAYSCAGEKVLSPEEQEELRTVFPVKISIKNDAVILKTPLLPSIYHWNNKAIAPYGWTYFSRWMGNEIETLLEGKIEEIPNLRRTNFSYLHVSHRPLNNTADADNYDAKHVTDTVARGLLLNDDCDSMTTSSYAIRDEELPEGSYLIVSENYGTPPTLDALKTLLKETDF